MVWDHDTTSLPGRLPSPDKTAMTDMISKTENMIDPTDFFGGGGVVQKGLSV